MLTNYIEAAMQKATYELLEDNSFYGEIPECQGVWGNAQTLEACRKDLQDALEGWIILGLRLGHALPVLDGIDLNCTKEVAYRAYIQLTGPNGLSRRIRTIWIVLFNENVARFVTAVPDRLGGLE